MSERDEAGTGQRDVGSRVGTGEQISATRSLVRALLAEVDRTEKEAGK